VAEIQAAHTVAAHYSNRHGFCQLSWAKLMVL
jgi:hypothetical protein